MFCASEPASEHLDGPVSSSFCEFVYLEHHSPLEAYAEAPPYYLDHFINQYAQARHIVKEVNVSNVLEIDHILF